MELCGKAHADRRGLTTDLRNVRGKPQHPQPKNSKGPCPTQTQKMKSAKMGGCSFHMCKFAHNCLLEPQPMSTQ